MRGLHPDCSPPSQRRQPGTLLVQEAKLLEGKVEKYEVAKRDCALLMPDGQPANNSRITELTAQQTALEAELVEHEAKNRLYLLLAQRTRHVPP